MCWKTIVEVPKTLPDGATIPLIVSRTRRGKRGPPGLQCMKEKSWRLRETSVTEESATRMATECSKGLDQVSDSDIGKSRKMREDVLEDNCRSAKDPP